MNQDESFMINLEDAFSIMGHIQKTKELEKKLKDCAYSSEELLVHGRESVQNGDYLEAKLYFDELWSTSSSIDQRDTAEIYGLLIFDFFAANLQKSIMKGYSVKIERIIYCMSEATRMYGEKKLSKEDLSTIEKLVDKIPYDKMIIPGRDEFAKIYGNFKEYCIKQR